MKRLFGFVLLAAHTLTGWATTEAIPVRLPTTITPTAYQLALQVDPNQTTHSGACATNNDSTANCADPAYTTTLITNAPDWRAARSCASLQSAQR